MTTGVGAVMVMVGVILLTAAIMATGAIITPGDTDIPLGMEVIMAVTTVAMDTAIVHWLLDGAGEVITILFTAPLITTGVATIITIMHITEADAAFIAPTIRSLQIR